MTDCTTSDLCPVPNPTIVDPSAVRNGQCAAAQDPNLPKRGSQGDPFNVERDQEMKITDSVEGQGKPNRNTHHLSNRSSCSYFCRVGNDNEKTMLPLKKNLFGNRDVM